MFKEEDFEIYESIIKEYVTKNIYNKSNDDFSKHILNIREIFDEIKIKFYDLKASTMN